MGELKIFTCIDGWRGTREGLGVWDMGAVVYHIWFLLLRMALVDDVIDLPFGFLAITFTSFFSLFFLSHGQTIIFCVCRLAGMYIYVLTI